MQKFPALGEPHCEPLGCIPHFTASDPTSLRYIWILSSHLHLSIQVFQMYLPFRFQKNFVFVLWLSSIHTSHPHIFTELIICIWLRVTLMMYRVRKDTECISTASHHLYLIMMIWRFSCTFSLPVTWFICGFKGDWNAVFIHDSQLQARIHSN